MSLVTVAALAASGVVNAFSCGQLSCVGDIELRAPVDHQGGVVCDHSRFGRVDLLMHKPRLETAPEALNAMASKVLEFALGTLIVLVVAIMGTLPPAWTGD